MEETENNSLWGYVKGLFKNPNDQVPLDSISAPVDSRSWTNRKAKDAANTLSVDTYVDTVWKEVLRSEGGYVNHPNDPGGETKFGISKRSFPHLDIPNLTPEDAKVIFKNNYYDAVGGDVVAKINPGLAAHLSDMAFNAGPKTAIKLLYDVAGLPRQDTITDSLVDRLDESPELVQNYTAARLKYYSSLGNAPTFMKGWTNRVRNLNKALGLSKGMEGLYSAAKDLDVDYLVAAGEGLVRNAKPNFAALTDQEKEYLRSANQKTNPLYSSRSASGVTAAQINDKQNSSLRDVFKATYDQKYYINTSSGQEELRRQQVNQAFEENFKALQEKLSPEKIKELGFERGELRKSAVDLFGNSESVVESALDRLNAAVAKLKQENPDIKLPYETANQVYEKIAQKAKDIERSYGELESGSFSGGLAEGFGKLMHVIGGYLPAQILGSLSDPIEAATNLVPAGKITQGAGLLKNMAAAFVGTGASQALVQSDKEKLGLQGSLVEGVAETAAATVGTGVLGLLGMGAKKLWSLGSRKAGQEAIKTADEAVAALSKEIPNKDIQGLKFQINQAKEVAKDYINNPYGDSFYAKQKLEAQVGKILSDWSQDLPLRDLPLETPKSFVPYDPKVAASWAKTLPPQQAAAFKQTVDFINNYRASYIAPARALDDIDVSVVPVLENGSIKAFNDEQAARDFIKTLGSGEELYVVKGDSAAPFYVAKHADLEEAAQASTRFTGGERAIVNGVEAAALKGDADLVTASQYPTYSKLAAKDFADARGTDTPTYGASKQMSVNPIEARRAQIEQAMATSQQDLDRAFGAAYDRIKTLSPKVLQEVKLDKEVAELIDDIDVTKADMSEVRGCFFGSGEIN